jgi:hypothetical protein
MGPDFESLESLRLLCAEIQTDQVRSLKYFEYHYGYQHVPGLNKKSVSSTATCVLSLVAAHRWLTGKAETKKLLEYLLSRKQSAGLEDDNPFTTAWILEAVTALQNNNYSDPLGRKYINEITRKEAVLQNEIENSDDGGVRMSPYPSSAYLTQLVVRTLRRRGALNGTLAKRVAKWAWADLARQFTLLKSKSKAQDPFAIAYLVILATSLTPSSTISPEQLSIRKAALISFFECQLNDGTWPLSRPLFHYPKFGNAYCYEYEMLTQLLQERELQDLLLDFLLNLRLAAESAASTNVYRLENGVRAWTSGHHPQLGEPESWATASVYHFVHTLDRLLAEAVRRELFRYLDLPRPNPAQRDSRSKDFASDVLDSTLKVRAKSRSLRGYLWNEFVKPISEEAGTINDGVPFSRTTPRSAIFYGPPGTSKTVMSEKIASFLGWPYLAIDPSVLLRHGMEGIQAEANTIFRMLEQTDGVVVLFDEFDELVRERGSRAEQPFSRLLTTAMLPKLARLHKRATSVFIIATNNIAEFDLAISRPGRFDRVLQVMPPTFEQKIKHTTWGPAKKIDIGAAFAKIGVHVDSDVEQQLGELTFDECDVFATQLVKASSPQEAIKALKDQWKDCTLQRKVPKPHATNEEETTWADRCKSEAGLSR